MKLSQTQQDALDQIRSHGGLIERWPGGFWTYRHEYGRLGPGVPDWGINIQTVRAMEKKGLLERTNTYPEEWRDTRRLVERT